MPINQRGTSKQIELLQCIDAHLATEAANGINLSHNNQGIRHNHVPGFTTWVSHSSRWGVDNSVRPDGQYWVNSMLIPLGLLDQEKPSDTGEILVLSSDSANDDVGGTGALTVLITGLDANWDVQTEIVTMTGLAGALTTNTFSRVNDLQVLTTGSAGWNVGNIYITSIVGALTAGVPTTVVYFTMAAEWNWGASGIYSTPRNTLTTTTHFKSSTDATEAKPLRMIPEANLFGGPVLRIGRLVFSSGDTNFVNDAFGALPGKSDWTLRSAGKSAGTIDTSVMWWGFVISDDATQGQ